MKKNEVTLSEMILELSKIHTMLNEAEMDDAGDHFKFYKGRVKHHRLLGSIIVELKKRVETIAEIKDVKTLVANTKNIKTLNVSKKLAPEKLSPSKTLIVTDSLNKLKDISLPQILEMLNKIPEDETKIINDEMSGLIESWKDDSSINELYWDNSMSFLSWLKLQTNELSNTISTNMIVKSSLESTVSDIYQIIADEKERIRTIGVDVLHSVRSAVDSKLRPIIDKLKVKDYSESHVKFLKRALTGNRALNITVDEDFTKLKGMELAEAQRLIDSVILYYDYYTSDDAERRKFNFVKLAEMKIDETAKEGEDSGTAKHRISMLKSKQFNMQRLMRELNNRDKLSPADLIDSFIDDLNVGQSESSYNPLLMPGFIAVDSVLDWIINQLQDVKDLFVLESKNSRVVKSSIKRIVDISKKIEASSLSGRWKDRLVGDVELVLNKLEKGRISLDGMRSMMGDIFLSISSWIYEDVDWYQKVLDDTFETILYLLKEDFSVYNSSLALLTLHDFYVKFDEFLIEGKFTHDFILVINDWRDIISNTSPTGGPIMNEAKFIVTSLHSDAQKKIVNRNYLISLKNIVDEKRTLYDASGKVSSGGGVFETRNRVDYVTWTNTTLKLLSALINKNEDAFNTALPVWKMYGRDSNEIIFQSIDSYSEWMGLSGSDDSWSDDQISVMTKFSNYCRARIKFLLRLIDDKLLLVDNKFKPYTPSDQWMEKRIEAKIAKKNEFEDVKGDLEAEWQASEKVRTFLVDALKNKDLTSDVIWKVISLFTNNASRTVRGKYYDRKVLTILEKNLMTSEVLGRDLYTSDDSTGLKGKTLNKINNEKPLEKYFPTLNALMDLLGVDFRFGPELDIEVFSKFVGFMLNRIPDGGEMPVELGEDLIKLKNFYKSYYVNRKLSSESWDHFKHSAPDVDFIDDNDEIYVLSEICSELKLNFKFDVSRVNHPVLTSLLKLI